MMQLLTAGEIVKATGGSMICGSENCPFTAISTNSKEITDGGLFVPIVGERFDAHKFIDSAFQNGASGTISHKKLEPVAGKTIIFVQDTKKAFGDIAKFYKEKYPIPTIAVTGSVGKTTTRDMMYAVISQKYNTLKTEGNFNNDIGLPITVFRQEPKHEAAVLEMGMSAFGEIRYLANIARPQAAVITNIGMAHIENLGSQENIRKAKMEITSYFKKDNMLIINGDDPYLREIKDGNVFKVMTFGENAENDVYAENIVDYGIDGVTFTAVADGKKQKITIHLPGVHNVYNALAAVASGIYFGIDLAQIAEGIETCKFTENRLEIEKWNGMTLIKDYYNASPASIQAALKVLSTAKDYRRVAVLGDVLEMGDFAKDAHYKLGSAVVSNGVQALITAGKNAEYIAHGAKDNGMKEVYSFETTEQAAEFAKCFLKEQDAVLMKASHGMHFEKIYEMIVK